MVKQLSASLALAAFLISIAVPARGGVVQPGCPGDAGTAAPAAVAASDSTCDHGGAGPCMDALGCVAMAPALTARRALLVTPDHLLVFSARLGARSGDLFRTGPPTPPPNQI
ncbi:MAG TPA: hypothetical protein VFO67_17305 [Gemmatimonadales bacterium]|nr:hypothetical protein [Gemmatimonadales bacterium]